MTQPIQEPGSSTRTDAKLTWGSNQLFRRPFPTTADPISYCHLRWDLGDTVPVDTIFNPATAGDYTEGFISDPDNASFQLDLTSGCIQWLNAGEYLIVANAGFNGGATVGAQLGVVIEMGTNCTFSDARTGNSVQAELINDSIRIAVEVPWFSFNPGFFGSDSTRVMVWHNDASGQDLNAVELHVYQMNASVAGSFVT